ncbi:hypothetical protein RvY_06071 [Ramazzottius varieornatus]|uniref:Uncharacterized protein n=1 Tax=Ramazzottius varieornatus TaxID=947166 RepID=A0A1D1V2S1_RAMVA|nr:hypothetical protein RvY_06071 [Ramazzottius varieornatus]
MSDSCGMFSRGNISSNNFADCTWLNNSRIIETARSGSLTDITVRWKRLEGTDWLRKLITDAARFPTALFVPLSIPLSLLNQKSKGSLENFTIDFCIHPPNINQDAVWS